MRVFPAYMESLLKPDSFTTIGLTNDYSCYTTMFGNFNFPLKYLFNLFIETTLISPPTMCVYVCMRVYLHLHPWNKRTQVHQKGPLLKDHIGPSLRIKPDFNKSKEKQDKLCQREY